MKTPGNWPQILFVAGVVALIAGALDPLEGSVVIAAGAILMAVSAAIRHDRHQVLFVILACLIVFGVAVLWYVSSLGGFDPKKEWWWWVFISPYPIGWLSTIALLLTRLLKK